MKYKLIVLLLLFLNCGKKSEVNIPTNASELSINESILIQNLKVISHDSMQGREYLTDGNRKARDFIGKEFSRLELERVLGTGYLQPFFENNISSGANILGKIIGASAKTILITAHYDHLGIVAGDIYNGADDNASGVSALITIADFYKGKLPNHTIVFAALDGEEVGLIGAQYLLNNYPSNVSDIVLNINLDMISRNDKNQLYASGTYHYPELKKHLTSITSEIELRLGHDNSKEDEEDWTYASDHFEFHQRNIPYIYFGVENHVDYHRPTDSFDKIDSNFYVEAVKVIIQSIENIDLNN